MENKVQCEKLYDLNENLLCDELYYEFFENKTPTAPWFVGLKKVFDAYNNHNGFSPETIQEFMDEDQINMLAIINDVIVKQHGEKANLIAIFTNYLTNEDGSKNLIKQICLIYQFGENSYLVLRTPLYSFTEYALGTYLEQVFEGGN